MDYERGEKYRKRVPLFEGLSPDEIADILSRGSTLRYPKGKAILHKGQCGNNLFVVFSGSVDIFRNERKITRCRVGDAFGEMSVLAHLPQEATAVAAEDVRLFALSESSINEILNRRVAVRFLLNVIHLLCRNFSIMVGDLRQMEIKITQQDRYPRGGDDERQVGTSPPQN